ncbi:hypothetical protein HGB25_02305 [Candidatus Saccharibacteria bacterium]|nr:hypothetical protein [Candidatus Saccharibacteria bacterium]
MVYTKSKLTFAFIFLPIFLCLLIISPRASAVYGGGAYGSSAYGTEPATTTSTQTTNNTSTPAITVVANNEDLTPKKEFVLGEPIVFSGTTVPFAEVHLYFQSEPFEAVTNADKDGVWSYTLTKDLGEGQHSLQIAIILPNTTTLSAKTEAKTFVLAAKTTTDTTNDDKTVATTTDQGSDATWLYVVAGVLILISILSIWWLIAKRRRQT